MNIEYISIYWSLLLNLSVVFIVLNVWMLPSLIRIVTKYFYTTLKGNICLIYFILLEMYHKSIKAWLVFVY